MKIYWIAAFNATNRIERYVIRFQDHFSIEFYFFHNYEQLRKHVYVYVWAFRSWFFSYHATVDLIDRSVRGN